MDRHMVLLGEEGKILDLLWDLLNNSIIIVLLVGTSQLLLPSGHIGFVPVTVVVSSRDVRIGGNDVQGIQRLIDLAGVELVKSA